MNKKYLIIGGVVLGVGVFAMAFLKRPKGKIVINKDGSGTVQLGNKTASFSKDTGVVVGTWNGWELSASATSMLLRHFGKTYHEGDITEYFGGTSDIEIVHNK
jgi:hypothetical protein